ncbi:MAG: cytochrome P450 [Kofleriaceae bacterium]
MLRTAAPLAVIPQPRTYPFLGNTPSIDIDSPIQSMMRLAKELGPVYRLEFPSQTALIIGDYNLVNELSDDARFEKKVHAPLKQLRDLGGDALFTAENDEPAWGIAHRLLMPAFGPSAMRRYWADMVDVCDQLVTKWERLGPSVEHDVPDNMTRLTLDTIALTGFGYRFNSYYQNEMHPFVDAMVRSLGEAGARARRLPIQSKLMFGTRRQYERDLALMYEVVDAVIRERKAKAKPTAQSRDLLDLLLEGRDPVSGASLDDVQIRFQIMTFLIAGHETTSGLLSFALHLLLQNPDAMAKLVAEVDHVLGSDRSRPMQFEDLAKLRYVEQSLKEALRLWPTAPAFGLTAKQDTTLANGVAIARGDTVFVLTPVLHRDPSVWSDPEIFDPDRFSPERAATIPPNAWKPFGTGQRACIGRAFAMQEATLVLAQLAWRFELSLPHPYELVVKESLTLKPEGLTVRAKSRGSVAAGSRPAPSVAAAPSKSTAPSAIPSATHGTPLLVLFGSNSGSSAEFADRFARDAIQRGYAPVVAPLDEYVGRLLREQGATIIITGSYNGQPPDNARAFVAWLDAIEPGALAGVRFLVLGCGHRDWASTYQAVPRKIEARLLHAGATPLHTRGEADAAGDFFGALESWTTGALGRLDAEFDVSTRALAHVPRYTLERVDGTSTSIAAAYGAVPMKVLENRELIRQGPRSKRHIEIDLPPGHVFRTGDYLAVLPENDSATVARAAARFALSVDDVVVVHRARDEASMLPIERPIRVSELLARYVELKAPATRSDVRALASACPCPPEARALQTLAAESYEREILDKRVSVLDLLERFASIVLPLSEYLELVPPLKPRRYSISSSSLAHPTRCTLTVAVLDAPALSGTGRYRGTCSTYLAALAADDIVHAYVTSPNTPFRLPDDGAIPVIMIAAGTGIAPFRGFVEERASRLTAGEQLGPAELYFGCDHPDIDFLYRDELAAWQERGAVDIHAAFYALPDGDVTFVQHRLWCDRERVAQLLAAGARIYVCGDGKRMAPAVRETLGRIYAAHHNVSVSDADSWLAECEASGRYVADVFSG